VRNFKYLSLKYFWFSSARSLSLRSCYIASSSRIGTAVLGGGLGVMLPLEMLVTVSTDYLALLGGALDEEESLDF
jgi:hypothetical protein